MFFTKVGRVLNYLFAVVETLRLVLAFLIASGVFPPEAQARYLGSHTTGEVIDRALYALVGCFFFGVLVEISLSHHNRGKVE
jgi:hypothetical protein